MKYFPPLLLFAFVLGACATPPSQDISTTEYVSRTTEPAVNVQVLDAWPIDKKYVVIGKVETNLTGRNAIGMLASKAKEMGGDAIVVGPTQIDRIVRVPLDISPTLPIVNVPQYKIPAQVIRFIA